MKRRSPLGGFVSAVGASLPLSNVLRQTQRQPLPYPPLCSSFIPVRKLAKVHAPQLVSEWSWAAAMSMIFSHNDRPVAQASASPSRTAIMSSFHLLLSFACLLTVTLPAWANEQEVCASSAGTLLIGTVVAGPRFAPGHALRGVELSHTHVRLRGNDGRFYDVAIDDVFADGYDQAGEHVPAPLSQIQPGDLLELCGKPYARGGPGMDWVHTNCGDRPTPDHPNGWVKVIGPDGTPGPNLEANQKYCPLWQRH